MESVQNMRQVSQMICAGTPLETEVRITLEALQRMTTSASVLVIDNLACAFIAKGYTAENAYGMAKQALHARASHVS